MCTNLLFLRSLAWCERWFGSWRYEYVYGGLCCDERQADDIHGAHIYILFAGQMSIAH
jgi:hypothetical protein